MEFRRQTHTGIIIFEIPSRKHNLVSSCVRCNSATDQFKCELFHRKITTHNYLHLNLSHQRRRHTHTQATRGRAEKEITKNKLFYVRIKIIKKVSAKNATTTFECGLLVTCGMPCAGCEDHYNRYRLNFWPAFE